MLDELAPRLNTYLKSIGKSKNGEYVALQTTNNQQTTIHKQRTTDNDQQTTYA